MRRLHIVGMFVLTLASCQPQTQPTTKSLDELLAPVTDTINEGLAVQFSALAFHEDAGSWPASWAELQQGAALAKAPSQKQPLSSKFTPNPDGTLAIEWEDANHAKFSTTVSVPTTRPATTEKSN
jgi:hypothetical protein